MVEGEFTVGRYYRALNGTKFFLAGIILPNPWSKPGPRRKTMCVFKQEDGDYDLPSMRLANGREFFGGGQWCMDLEGEW